MKRERTLIGLAVSGMLLAGCAGMQSVQPWCAIGAGLLGAGIGVGVHEGVKDDDDSNSWRAPAAVAGAIIGTAVGALVCPEDKKPQPATAPQPVAVAAAAIAPPADSDGDGVPDDRDKCPDTPAGQKVDADGCSEVGAVLLRLENVNFEFNKARITPESEQVLDQAVQMLGANPNITVSVDGHTDSIGSERYNLRLSQRRAEAVRDYLVSRGISAGRLAPVGKGESAPIASNKTAEGRSQNRRVEFVVTGK